MEQGTLQRCIEHCTRAIEGLRQEGTRPDVALMLDDARCMLLANMHEADPWNVALAQLPREPRA